jgi:RiboL-PSP-HEPN
MPRSKRWRDLQRETNRLRRHFLPERFDPLGMYPDATRVQAHTRAFLVLCHAEFEGYLEGWAREIARVAETAWTTSNKVTKPLAFLFATISERVEVPVTLVGPNAKDSPQKLADASVKLFQKYYKLIRDNNGVKERNVLALFGPLGLPASALSSTLLPSLDSLGALRGSHAHESAKAVASVLDPQTEYDRVTALLNDLVTLDDWLANYRRAIR